MKGYVHVITVLVLGVLSGSIFLLKLNDTDKSGIILQIKTFINNINADKINNGLAIRNSLIINYLFVFLIWGFGLSIVGVLINIFLTYIKGFIVGFSISSIFLTYKYKGLPMALIYVFPVQIINVITICVLTIYSIMFSYNLLSIIVNKKYRRNNKMLGKYLIILLFSLIISFISAMTEVYLFPRVLKIIISLYK